MVLINKILLSFNVLLLLPCTGNMPNCYITCLMSYHSQQTLSSDTVIKHCPCGIMIMWTVSHSVLKHHMCHKTLNNTLYTLHTHMRECKIDFLKQVYSCSLHIYAGTDVLLLIHHLTILKLSFIFLQPCDPLI